MICWRSPPAGSSRSAGCRPRRSRPRRGELMTGIGASRSLLLATRNPHKLREFDPLLAPASIPVDPLPDEVTLPPEDGDTFAANALPKARAAAAATGRVAIADD